MVLKVFDGGGNSSGYAAEAKEEAENRRGSLEGHELETHRGCVSKCKRVSRRKTSLDDAKTWGSLYQLSKHQIQSLFLLDIYMSSYSYSVC